METPSPRPGSGRAFVAALLALVFIGAAASQSQASTKSLATGPFTKELEDGLVVYFEILPRPIPPMKELNFAVNLSRAGKPLEAFEVLLDLTMPGMFMGKNSPTLVRVGPGRFEGRGVLPRCMSGDRHWQALLTLRESGGSHRIIFPFEVAEEASMPPPASSSGGSGQGEMPASPSP